MGIGATVDSQNKNTTNSEIDVPPVHETWSDASDDKRKCLGTPPGEKHKRLTIFPEEIDKSIARRCDRLMARVSFAEWSDLPTWISDSLWRMACCAKGSRL